MKLNRFVLSVSVLCGVALGSVWSEPERIGYHDGGGDLAVDNQGICWCITHLSVYSYRNDVLGWQPETEITFQGYPCFDKGDTLWNLGYPGAFEMYYVRYNGASWSELEYVPTGPYNPEGSIPWDPITADSSGGVWVGWTSWEYTVMACNRYQDGSWEGVELLLDAEPNEYYKLLALSTDASGRVWAGWGKTEYYEPYKTYCEVAYNDGGVWSEPIYVGESDYWDVSWLTFAPDREEGMWVIWNDSTYRALARYWNGTGWEATDTVAENGFYPRGAVDSNGNVWLVWWQEKPSEDIDIYYSVNSGSGWSEPAPIDTNPALDRYPDIAVDGAGRIWCVWASERDDSSAIYASYTTGVSVEEPATPVTHHKQPTLTVDKSVGCEFTFRVSPFDDVGEIVIYDANGREVSRLTIGNNCVARWDGTDEKGSQPAGVYFARFSCNRSISKLVLLR